VQISNANTLAPCTNPPILDSKVTLVGGASVSVVAAISSGQPTLLQFTDNLSPVTPGNARFVFVQASDRPALKATLTQLFVKNPKTVTVTASPGKQQAANLPEGTYLVEVFAAGSTTVLASGQISFGRSVRYLHVCYRTFRRGEHLRAAFDLHSSIAGPTDTGMFASARYRLPRAVQCKKIGSG
jgi:hypothetical protein